MPQSLDKSELTGQELAFLDAFSFLGNKRQALAKAGYGNNLTKDQIYYKAGHILAKAQRSSAWQDALARHGMTYDEMAQRLQELIHSSDSRTAIQALKLAMQSADLLREKAEQATAPTEITIHIMQPGEKVVNAHENNISPAIDVSDLLGNSD